MNKIDIPETLKNQAGNIWQLLANVPNPAIQSSGVRIEGYDYPSADTVVYRIGDETMTLAGIHLADYGTVNWSNEITTATRIVDEVNVLEGAPVTLEYDKTDTENQTLEEATVTGLETGFRAGLGDEFGTGISITGKVKQDYEKKFGKSSGQSQSKTFKIGPITEPGKYRIESYSFQRNVSSRPVFDFHAIWKKDSNSDNTPNRIEWWKRVEFEHISQVEDLIKGLAADDVGVLHSGRVVHGDYGSYTTNPDKPLAPIFRANRQPNAIVRVPVRPIAQTVQYGQGTRIVKVD